MPGGNYAHHVQTILVRETVLSSLHICGLQAVHYCYFQLLMDKLGGRKFHAKIFQEYKWNGLLYSTITGLIFKEVSRLSIGQPETKFQLSEIFFGCLNESDINKR